MCRIARLRAPVALILVAPLRPHPIVESLVFLAGKRAIAVKVELLAHCLAPLAAFSLPLLVRGIRFLLLLSIQVAIAIVVKLLEHSFHVPGSTVGSVTLQSLGEDASLLGVEVLEKFLEVK